MYKNRLPMKLATNLYMKIWSLVLVLVASIAGAKADNNLVVKDFDIVPGETKTISVSLDNSDPISSLQFDMSLPEGLNYVAKSTKKNKSRLKMHALSGTRRDENTVRFVILHEAEELAFSAFTGNSGEIFTFEVKADMDYKGGKIVFSGIVGSDGTQAVPVEHRMNDLTINAGAYAGSFSLSEENISKHMIDDCTATVDINIANIVKIVGMQAYIELPENLIVESFTVGERVSENYTPKPASLDKSGVVLLSSLMHEPFDGNEGAVLTLNLKAVGAVKGQLIVKDVVATESTGMASYKFEGEKAVNVEFIPYYTVSIAEGIENGEVKADVDKAEEGATVTLTATPAEGFLLETLTVMAGEENVELSEANTFVMPAGDVTVSATFVKEIPTIDIAKEFTDIESCYNQAFAIVNKETGKVLYGTNNQKLGYDTADKAFVESNSGYYFKIDKASDEKNNLLRLLTPAGAEYNIWGNPGYLNSQVATGNCSFILGLNNQNGQDIENGAVWEIEYVDGKGFTMKNVGTGLYLTSNDAAKSEEPVYWTFCTINGFEAPEVTTGIDEIDVAKAANGKYMENGKIVIVKNGVKMTVSGLKIK